MEIVRETNFNILLKIFLTTTIAGGKWNKKRQYSGEARSGGDRSEEGEDVGDINENR